MTDLELKRILDLHIKNALSIGELSQDQADALDYYYGRPYGNEVEGQSQVVTRDVLETVEWAMPSLMRIFATERSVEFDPVGPEDIAAADQETDAIRHVAWKYSDGFTNVYDWCKDGLLQRVGYAKVYVESDEETVQQTFEGLTEQDLLQFPDDSIIALDELVIDTEIGPMLAYNATVELTKEKKRVKWTVIEPNQIRISKRIASVCLDDVDFVAHVEEYTQSELIEMGYSRKVVESLPDYDDLGSQDSWAVENARAGHSGEEEAQEDWAEKATRPIEVWECYVRTDQNGDGIAELMRIVYAGDKILKKEEIDDLPIVAWSPIPMPHQHAGLSLADMVMDLQKIRSTLLRQMLDNLYLTNNPEKEVVWNNVVDPDDLLQSVPGGLKRVTQGGTITPLTVPFTAGASLPVFDLLNNEKESRTGISRHTMGLDADVLAQSTKGAFMGAMEQANGRLEMIARLFAENGLKKLYLKLHALMVAEIDEELRMQLNGEFVAVSPSQWQRRTDMTVTVGTGNASIEQRAMLARQVMDIQERIVQAGGMGRLVTEQNVFNAAADFVDAIGKTAPDRYFTDASKLPPPQPQPDQNQQFMMMQLEIERMKEQNRREIEMMKAQLDAQKLQLEAREQTRKETETEAAIARDIAGMGSVMQYPRVMPE